MSTTEKSPGPSLGVIKRTKILATLGPSSSNYETILTMVKRGVNGFRLNFSHGTYEERIEQIGWIRKAAAEAGENVAIIQDLQGPRIRLGDFNGVIPVREGQELQLSHTPESSNVLPVQYDLSQKLKRGDRVLLYDGKVKSRVTSVRAGVVHIRVENDGILTGRKGINLPDTDFGGEVITKKDRADIAFGSEQDIDFIALSFVHSTKDIEHLRQLLKNLGSKAKIIAKVETKAAADAIEAIVRESDGVMVARGDLAVETSLESVPVLQRTIVDLCQQYQKISIVATQMLASMTDQPEPTRAEVSDVATAVVMGADVVMLSDETASGRYPLEAVDVINRVILHTQDHSSQQIPGTRPYEYNVTEAIAATVIDVATKVQARAIVAETKTGATAVAISSWRPTLPLLVVTSELRVAQQLALLYGARTFVRPIDKSAATKLTDWLRSRHAFAKGDKVVTASGKYPGLSGGTDTIKVRVLE